MVTNYRQSILALDKEKEYADLEKEKEYADLEKDRVKADLKKAKAVLQKKDRALHVVARE